MLTSYYMFIKIDHAHELWQTDGYGNVLRILIPSDFNSPANIACMWKYFRGDILKFSNSPEDMMRYEHVLKFEYTNIF